MGKSKKLKLGLETENELRPDESSIEENKSQKIKHKKKNKTPIPSEWVKSSGLHYFIYKKINFLLCPLFNLYSGIEDNWFISISFSSQHLTICS